MKLGGRSRLLGFGGPVALLLATLAIALTLGIPESRGCGGALPYADDALADSEAAAAQDLASQPLGPFKAATSTPGELSLLSLRSDGTFRREKVAACGPGAEECPPAVEEGSYRFTRAGATSYISFFAGGRLADRYAYRHAGRTISLRAVGDIAWTDLDPPTHGSRTGARVFKSELDDLVVALKENGAAWTAGHTPQADLSEAEWKRHMGAVRRSRYTPFALVRDAAMAALALPGQLDWRNYNGLNYLTPVRNQGSCGSCWAFSATAALESYALRTQGLPGQNLDLSEQILLSCSGAGSCNGGDVGEAAGFINSVGLGLEAAYPYAGKNGNCANAAGNWRRGASRIGSWSYVTGSSPANVNVIKSALLSNGPLPTTMEVYTDFKWYLGGTYSHHWGWDDGSHAVLIVGYDDGGQYFIVKNSWGKLWGLFDGGYFKIAYSQVGNGVQFGAWTIAFARANDSDVAVHFTSPANQATISGQATIAGGASVTTDNVTLAEVWVQVDGGASSRAAGTTAWSYVLNAAGLAPGAHTINARAVDSTGNSAVASLAVTVAPAR